MFSPVFHNKLPGAVVDNMEEPQLFTTVITGIAGTTFGAATPEPVALVQVPIVCVTV